MRKVMDVLLLCHTVTYEPQTVVEGQERFTKCGMLWGIPPIV